MSLYRHIGLAGLLVSENHPNLFLKPIPNLRILTLPKYYQILFSHFFRRQLNSVGKLCFEVFYFSKISLVFECRVQKFRHTERASISQQSTLLPLVKYVHRQQLLHTYYTWLNVLRTPSRELASLARIRPPLSKSFHRRWTELMWLLANLSFITPYTICSNLNTSAWDTAIAAIMVFASPAVQNVNNSLLIPVLELASLAWWLCQ